MLYVQQKQCSVMPPKTNAERSRTQREKIKNDNVNYEAAKKTDRERKQQARRLKKASATASEKKRKERDAKRRQRQKKKDARAQTTVNDEHNGPYKTKNTLGKAVSKVKRALPATPNRESHVLGALLCSLPREVVREQRNEVCNTVKEPNVRRACLFDTERKKRSDTTSAETVHLVNQFYLRDDVSRMCPGKKDCLSIKDPKTGKREQKQKRLLYLTLSEAHKLFCEEFGEIIGVSRMCPGKKDCLSLKDPKTGKREQKQKRLLYLTLSEAHKLFCEEFGEIIGLTKFTELRPPYVRPMTMHDQEVCMCKYHQNVELLATGIHKVVPAIPCDPVQVAELTVCDLTNTDCVDRIGSSRDPSTRPLDW